MSQHTNRWEGILLMVGFIIVGFSPVSLALQDPLNAQVRFALPPSVTTVADAFKFFLDPYAYQLTSTPPASPSSKAGFRASLPLPLPHDEVMTVKQALLVVTPEAWAIVIDHPNKLVSLDPRIRGNE